MSLVSSVSLSLLFKLNSFSIISPIIELSCNNIQISLTERVDLFRSNSFLGI